MIQPGPRHPGDSIRPPRPRGDQSNSQPLPCTGISLRGHGGRLFMMAGDVFHLLGHPQGVTKKDRSSAGNGKDVIHALIFKEFDNVIGDAHETDYSSFNSLLKKSEKHPNPSFRRTPESSILLISFILISWTPAFAG